LSERPTTTRNEIAMTREWYQVNEIFTSIQGEGVLVGTPATFIRLQGCTVGCWWCDSGPLADKEGRTTNGQTRNTWFRGGNRMTVDTILEQVEEKHVIITGGEPTLWNLDPLIDILRANGHIIQLETSGQNALKGEQKPDWITWSPKENLGFSAPPQIRDLSNEVKFVVDATLTFEIVWGLYKRLWNERLSGNLRAGPMPSFVLMPEGSPPTRVSIERTMNLLNEIPSGVRNQFRFGQRLQYQLEVR
jgi:7-carboxy-7-deazaguanine synthase